MATHDVGKQECFLCVLDPHPICRVRQLEGRILAAFERIRDGEKIPVVIIETGTARAEVRLTHYYRKFVKDLHERGVVIQNLILRPYHLHSRPSATQYE